MPVFKVDKDFQIVLSRDAVRLAPELSSLTQDELLYIILVMDYHDSPFRKKAFEERRSLAIKRIYKDKVVNLENQRIYDAMNAYKSLVFDIRYETLDTLKAKAEKYRKELLNPDIDFKRMKDIDQSLQYLEERVDSVERSLFSDEIDNIEIKGQKKLSQVEIWQRRQKEYQKYKQD